MKRQRVQHDMPPSAYSRNFTVGRAPNSGRTEWIRQGGHFASECWRKQPAAAASASASSWINVLHNFCPRRILATASSTVEVCNRQRKRKEQAKYIGTKEFGRVPPCQDAGLQTRKCRSLSVGDAISSLEVRLFLPRNVCISKSSRVVFNRCNQRKERILRAQISSHGRSTLYQT